MVVFETLKTYSIDNQLLTKTKSGLGTTFSGFLVYEFSLTVVACPRMTGNWTEFGR